MAELGDNELITPPVRLRWAHLDKPRSFDKERDGQNGKKPKYEITVLIPPGQSLRPYKKIIQLVCDEEFKGKKFYKGDPKKFKHYPLRDAEEKDEYDGMEEGWTFFTCRTGRKPTLIGPNMEDDFTADDFYNGCWVKLRIDAYAYEYKEDGKVVSRGSSLGFKVVQFVKDDDEFLSEDSEESLDGFSKIDEDDFDDEDDEDDEEEEEEKPRRRSKKKKSRRRVEEEDEDEEEDDDEDDEDDEEEEEEKPRRRSKKKKRRSSRDGIWD